MESLFLFCFAFGALFTAVTIVLGGLGGGLDGAHGGHDLLGGHHADAGTDVATTGHGHGFDPLAYVNLSSIMAFFTCFGGMGLVATHYLLLAAVVASGAALAAGLAGGGMVGWFMAKLRASEVNMRAEDYRLEGTLADVTVTIPDGGVGEIVFTLMGVRRSEAARGATGTAFPRGSKVVITGYERGVARVEQVQAFLGDASPEAERARLAERQRPNPDLETD